MEIYVGELDPKELKDTTIDINKRRLKQVKIEDEAAVARMFNNLMGGAVGPRKSFIEDNAHKANIII